MSEIESADDGSKQEAASAPGTEVSVLPSDISPGEVIVRALKTPVHYDFKKGRLKPAAYRPRAGQRVISVARAIVGIDECKKNIKIFDAKNEYIGFGAIYAQSIRSAGSSVYDEPKDFFGHAHVEHPVDAPVQDEPNFAEKNEEYIPLLHALVKKTTSYIDQKREDVQWGGPEVLEPPAS